MASTSNKKKQGKRVNQKTTKKSTSKSKKAAVSKDTSFMKSEITIWLVLAFCIFCVISNFGLAGFVGDAVAGILQKIFGWVAYIFPFCLFGGFSFVISNKGNSTAYIKTAAGTFFMILVCLFLQILNRPKRYLARTSMPYAKVNFEDFRRFYIDKEWMQDIIDQ